MERIKDLEDFFRRDAEHLVNTQFKCPLCGKNHDVPIGAIRCAPGSLAELPAHAQRALGCAPQHAVMLYDIKIEAIIRAQVIEPLARLGFTVSEFPLGTPGEYLDADVEIGNAAAARLPAGADLLIGAGSGVVSDLTKWTATRAGLPFILVGTAPSMNGHASITGAMTEGSIKVTELLNPAAAVLFDVDILYRAPREMLLAGMGDLTARAICNADWKLSEVLKGRYFCPLPYLMTAENEARYLAAAEGIGRADPEAIGILSETQLMSALSMTVLEDGETSSSSGAEHILSHYWDLQHHLRGLPKNFHGTQVGVATVLSLALYEMVREIDPQTIDPQALLAGRPTLESMLAENQRLYGEHSGEIDGFTRAKYIPDAAYLEHLQIVQATWTDIWRQVSPYVASLDSIRAPLLKAGFPLSLSGIRRSADEVIEALLQGPRYRARYTILDLAWELGVFPGRAPEVLARAGVQ